MKRKIYAAVFAALLAVSLMFSLPVTAEADYWEDTIAQYDGVFAVTDEEPEAKFKALYNALLLDPTTFTNQLAFRNAETKEYVLYILTGEWVTPEQLDNMTQAVESLHTDLEKTTSEIQLIDAIYERFVCASYQYMGVATDCVALMEWVRTADPAGAYDLSLELAYALIGTPEAFLLQLASEEESVQNRVIELLQIHNATYLATTIVNCISGSEASIDPQTADLVLKIYTSLGYKGAPLCSDPDPEEYKIWLAEPPLVFQHYYNYKKLFANMSSENASYLVEALLSDTENFINELAFRDVVTKRSAFSVLSCRQVSNVQLEQMRICLRQYADTHRKLTLSEIQLLSAMIYQLEFAYYNHPKLHRDNTILFAQAISDLTYDEQLPFCDELKLAFIANPNSFISQLTQEQELVQNEVIRLLCFDALASDALFMRMVNSWALERKIDANTPGYYTEEGSALLLQFSQHLQMLPEVPKISEPDPEELENWLEEKGPLIDDPGMTLPIYPDQTQPGSSETTTPEETQPATDEIPEKDNGWISTVCFTLGFLCLGIAAGGLIAKKKKAKNAPAQPEPLPPMPAEVFPKLLYCPAPLSRDIQKQITLALREKYDEYSVHWYSIKQTDGTCRCYGTDNGYDIIFYAGGLRMEIPASCTVGEYTFLFETSFELYAHKDGNLTDLNTALEQGLVSQQAVQEALEKHNSISQ